MKTIIRITKLVILLIMPSLGQTQTITVCAGSSGVVTAINSLSLTNPSYSMNPGGISAVNPTFTVTPASTTTYTLYVTGTNSNAAVVTTSNVVMAQVAAVPVTSVTPISQTINCGPAMAVTATCIAILPATNVTHNWYASGSPLPLSSGGQLSTYNMSGYNGTAATYTCVVVDNSTGCSTSKTVQVISTGGNYPTFSLTSVNNFTLGCATRSVTDVNVVGANTLPPGGVVSYTLLAPSFTGTFYPTNPVVSNYTTNIPGNYTVIVRDNGNFCETRIPLSILQNTNGPSIIASVSTQTLSCLIPSVTLQGSSNTANVSYVWKKNTLPPLTPSSFLPVMTTTAGASVPSATVIDNYTLSVLDAGNQCSSSTVVTLWQNIRPPIAGIAVSNTPFYPPTSCQIFSANATNTSTTGMLPNTFPVAGPLNAILWQGPPPQVNASNVSTYLCSTSGVYTMTVMDMNNGCTNTATCNVTVGLQAAFVYTIASGQAIFNDVSNGSGINTNYFWDFGDGFMSTSQNPVHNYTNGGAHLVKFKISNQFCSDSVWQSVNVSGIPCNANSNFAMVPTNTAQVWNAIPNYPWNVVAASWDWGDNSSSNTLYTAHQYSAAGNYYICLSVTVSCVASSSTCITYSVYRQSQAAQIIAVNVIAPGLVSGIVTLAAGETLSWNIQPNPNAGEFQLNLNGAIAGTGRMVIHDLIGRVVHEQFIESNSGAIPIYTDHLPAGLYLVTLESGGIKTSKRMVVNH